MSTLNWSDLIKEAGETGTYDALPDGDYDLVVLEATAKVSQSGKTMFAIKTQVEGGAHNKRLVWDNLVVSPDSPAAGLHRRCRSRCSRSFFFGAGGTPHELRPSPHSPAGGFFLIAEGSLCSARAALLLIWSLML